MAVRNLSFLFGCWLILLLSCRNESAGTSSDPEKDPLDSIYQLAQEKPRFPGCEDLQGEVTAKIKCSEEKLLQYLYSKLKYPQYALENQIEGRCVVSFVVEKDGSVSQPRIVKDIGGGCGEEAIRVIQSMNDMPERWVPGRQDGLPVRVKFNLPVKFQLKESSGQEDSE
jgi:protein TonB